MELSERCRKIKLLLLDVDGVLTDGRLYFGPNGEEFKQFYVRDGYGLKLWHEAGFKSAIITGRESTIVENRGKELGISISTAERLWSFARAWLFREMEKSRNQPG